MQTERAYLTQCLRAAKSHLARVESRRIIAELRASLVANTRAGRQLEAEHPLWAFVDGWRWAEGRAQGAVYEAEEALYAHEDETLTAHAIATWTEPEGDVRPGDGAMVVAMQAVRS